MGDDRLIYRLYRAGLYSLDYLFPPACLGCGRAGEHWCPKCEDGIARLNEPLCEVCGEENDAGGLCERCRDERPAFEAARALGRYEGALRNALVGLKYRRDAVLGIVFADKLTALIEREGWQVDGIVPIPLARQRTLERGYNQVEAFSAALAHYLGCRQGNGWLRRVRETRSQVGLDVGARKENMQDAFKAAGHMVAGKNLVLMDDVMTTGATLDSAAHALKRAGASKVYGLTIARAMSTKSDDLI